MELRRGNSGVDVAFGVIECILSIDLGPEVFDHPSFSSLRRLAGNMLFAANVSLSQTPACCIPGWMLTTG